MHYILYYTYTSNGLKIRFAAAAGVVARYGILQNTGKCFVYCMHTEAGRAY